MSYPINEVVQISVAGVPTPNLTVLCVDANGNPINFGNQAAVSFAPDTISTDGAVALTGANMVHSVVATGLTDGATWTFPTAAAIVAAVTSPTAGQTWQFQFTNTSGFPITTANNTGITHTTPDIVQAGNAVSYQIKLVSVTASAEAVTITREWSVAAGS